MLVSLYPVTAAVVGAPWATASIVSFGGRLLSDLSSGLYFSTMWYEVFIFLAYHPPTPAWLSSQGCLLYLCDRRTAFSASLLLSTVDRGDIIIIDVIFSLIDTLVRCSVYGTLSTLFRHRNSKGCFLLSNFAARVHASHRYRAVDMTMALRSLIFVFI